MSKFINLLEQTMDGVEGDPSALPPMAPAGPTADLADTTPDSVGVTDEEKLSLIKLARDLFFTNPEEIRTSGQFDRLVEILEGETNSSNADEQLSALKQILRDNIDTDTGIKSASDGSIER